MKLCIMVECKGKSLVKILGPVLHSYAGIFSQEKGGGALRISILCGGNNASKNGITAFNRQRTKEKNII